MCWSCIPDKGRLEAFGDVKAGMEEDERALECLLFFRFFLNFQKILKILFIYLREWASERAWAGGGAEGEGEADSLLSREPSVGLNPRTLGPWPELKADAWPTELPGAAHFSFFDTDVICILELDFHYDFMKSLNFHHNAK